MYISGHPLDAYAEQLGELDAVMLHQLAELPDHSEVLVAGMILSNKTIVTKKGQPMAFMELEDRIDKVEVVLFPETWKNAAPLVQKGRLVLVRAKLQLQDEDPPKLLAEQLAALDDPAGRPAASPAACGRIDDPLTSQRSACRARLPRRRRAQRRRCHAGGPRSGPPERLRQPTRCCRAKAQRVFVKISADCEQPDKLLQLKALLKLHKGRLAVALFYESSNKLLALSDQYLGRSFARICSV